MSGNQPLGQKTAQAQSSQGDTWLRQWERKSIFQYFFFKWCLEANSKIILPDIQRVQLATSRAPGMISSKPRDDLAAKWPCLPEGEMKMRSQVLLQEESCAAKEQRSRARPASCPPLPVSTCLCPRGAWNQALHSYGSCWGLSPWKRPSELDAVPSGATHPAFCPVLRPKPQPCSYSGPLDALHNARRETGFTMSAVPIGLCCCLLSMVGVLELRAVGMGRAAAQGLCDLRPCAALWNGPEQGARVTLYLQHCRGLYGPGAQLFTGRRTALGLA